MSSVGAVALVVLVAAYGGGGDFEVVEELLGLAGVFAGDAVDLLQDVEGAEGDVAEVADGGGDEVEAGCEGVRRDSAIGGISLAALSRARCGAARRAGTWNS